MDEATLETHIGQLMEYSPGPQVDVAWQGGEPILRGLDFYKRSVALAERYRKPHQRILHTIQTNGTLIDDEWARFFKRHNYLAGLSTEMLGAPTLAAAGKVLPTEARTSRTGRRTRVLAGPAYQP